MIVDLHVHTKFSDGLMSPREVLKIARRIGLSGVAITDHDTVDGCLEAIRANVSGDLLVVPGIEVSTPSGHILVYGLHEAPRKNVSVEELIDYARSQGAVTALAHPFGKVFFGKYPIVDSEIVERLDLIEGINGRIPMVSNRKAIALALAYGKPAIGGSDAHIPEELGTAATYLLENCENVDDFLVTLRKGLCRPIGNTSFTNILGGVVRRFYRRVLLTLNIITLR